LKHFNSLSTLVVSSFLLAACGGGGGGDSAPAPAAAGSARLTQSDIQTTARLGALTLLTSDLDAKLLASVGGESFISLSTFSSASTSPRSAPCTNGGTLSVSVTKSATRVGFAAGDQLLIGYSNCNLSGTVLNGSMRLTALGTISSVGSIYDIRYAATLTNWSIRTTSTTTFSGNADINYSNTVTAMTVPANQSLSISFTGSSGTSTTTHRAGTSTRSVDTASPNTASRSLNGSLIFTNNAGQFNLDVSTVTAFTGTTSSGRFVPNTGTMTLRQSGNGSNASVSVSGNMVTVGGDTDGNGTQDLSFTTTWTALTF
jgi:hypothetical protein